MSEKVLFYSLPPFLFAGIFGGSTAKNKKKQLCVLCVSAVRTIRYLGCGDLTITIITYRLQILYFRNRFLDITIR